MKFVFTTLVLLFSLTILMTVGCQNEQNFQPELLIGEWEVMSATRQGNPTETLNGVFFDFSENNQLTSDFPLPGFPQNQSVPFKIKNRTLTEIGDTDLILTVKTLNETSLVLTMNYEGFDIEMNLQRAD